MASRIAEIQLSDFDGGMLPLPPGDDSEALIAGCVATAGLPKARCCIASLYNMYLHDGPNRRTGCLNEALVVNFDKYRIVVK